MKKITLFTLTLFTLIFTSCKNNEKKEDAKTKESAYVVEADSTIVKWTAFKTTEKVPVNGSFTKVTIENLPKGENEIDALNGLKFSIPVSGIFSNDTIRDGKLKKFFFGTLENTKLISGTISVLTDSTGTAEITMNGISKPLPISFNINDKKVAINTTMNLEDWNAQPAIDALNAVCKDLHSGDDGISKTWNEVLIKVTTSLKYQ